jgi:RimJ/RimL family protein N-acetyltransferase
MDKRSDTDTMIKLETERLVLRPLGTGDFDAYYSYSSVPENMTYMIFGPYTPEEAMGFLQRCENWWKEDPPRVYEFAATLRDSGKMIGNCGLYLDDEKRATGMLGWCYHRDYWNRGYATESVKALLRFGFEELKLHRIHAECNADNIASARVMEHVGMRREGHFIKNRFDRVGDQKMWYSEFFYGILREEYVSGK